MKTIRIRPTEELTSIIDRLEKEKNSEIILEIPSGAQIFASLINFKLLKRWAGLLDKLVTISTEDETGAFLAQKRTFKKSTFTEPLPDVRLVIKMFPSRANWLL